jgi:hypothetical protein
VGEISGQELRELKDLVKMRKTAARATADARKAQVLADFEEELSTKYDMYDAAWADVTTEVERVAAQANEQIRTVCEERGVRKEFMPDVRVGWSYRGENAIPERRAELRKAAQARADASAKTAKAIIEGKAVEALTELVARGLDSDAARALLVSLPTPEQLMPPLSVKELEAAITHERTDPYERRSRALPLELDGGTS